MKIEVSQNNNISMQKKPPLQRLWDAIPEYTHKDSAKKLERWKKIDEFISKPAENRGIMMVTALMTQPAIDYYNPKVDKETNIVARNRTTAKILAGGTVGMFVVRGPLYKLITKMTNPESSSKYSQSLLPKKYLKEITSNEKFLKNYRNALSMITALGAMCFTNFALDAPLTIFLTNLFNETSGVDIKKEVSTEKLGGCDG